MRVCGIQGPHSASSQKLLCASKKLVRGSSAASATSASRVGRSSARDRASVGESLTILPLVERLRAEKPKVTVLVTSGTTTSAALLAKRLPPGAFHQYVPVDAPGSAKRFVAHWRPSLAVFVESELWPNLLLEAKAAGTRLALVSAKLSDRSFARWSRRPDAARRLLSGFDLILAQDARAQTRFEALGGQARSELPPDAEVPAHEDVGPREAALRNPSLEAFDKKGWDVLLLTDPVDEWMISAFSEFEGKPLKSVSRGELELDDEDDDTDKADLTGLLPWMEETLSGRVAGVRKSVRLTDSAAVLVDSDDGISSNMERILKQASCCALVERQAVKFKNPECAVCLDDMTPGDLIATTRCQHTFHHACLKTVYNHPLAAGNPLCPFCRAELNYNTSQGPAVGVPIEE